MEERKEKGFRVQDVLHEGNYGNGLETQNSILSSLKRGKAPEQVNETTR